MLIIAKSLILNGFWGAFEENKPVLLIGENVNFRQGVKLFENIALCAEIISDKSCARLFYMKE